MIARRAVLVFSLVIAACSSTDPSGTGGGSGGSGGGSGGGGGTGGGSGGGSAGGLCHLGSIDVAANATWSGPVTVDCSVRVRPGVTLTLSAGATLNVSPGVLVTVEGSLVAQGTAAAPVVFKRAGAAPWGPLLFESGSGARTFSLTHTRLEGAGDTTPVETSNTMGAAVVLNDQTTPLLVSDVTIDGASGIGVVLQAGGFAPGSQNLTVSNSGSYAAFVTARFIGTVPTGSYASNGKAGILVESAWIQRFSGDTRITTDTTIKKLDVPWIIGTGVYKSDLRINTVQSGPPDVAVTPPLVTIEAGAELRFARVKSFGVFQSQILIDKAVTPVKALGALRAVGTAAEPIVFTSAETTPAPGDWSGLSLSELDSRTQLEHVTIAWAGADSRARGACPTGSPQAAGGIDADAALQLFIDVATPVSSTFTNSVISDSAGGGVYRGFKADVDFTGTNTFTNLAWCRQSSVSIGSACVPAMCN